MKVQVYGSGCEKCKKLAANVETAAKELGVEIELDNRYQYHYRCRSDDDAGAGGQ